MEHTLPYDYSRCLNEECPMRGLCLRWLAPGSENTPFVRFTPETPTSCSEMIHVWDRK